MARDPAESLDRILDDATAGAEAGPCPDENVLAALAEGGLDERDRAGALDHLTACAGCRDVVRALLPHVAGAGQGARTGRLLPFPRWLAVAAAILLAAGAAYWTSRRGGAPGVSGDSAAALEVAAARLAREAPEEFGDFRPFDLAELRSRRADPLRGDDVEASPSARIVDPRPTFRWRAIAGTRTYRVTLLGPEGVRWERTTSATALPWPDDVPALAPGSRAAWTLSADDPHGTEVRRAIEVPGDVEIGRWRRAEQRAASVATPDRWLLLAHAALRHDLPTEAAGYAARFLDERPGDPLAEATLASAKERLAGR